MKKAIKIFYITLMITAFISLIYLIISPLQHNINALHYEAKNKIYINEYEKKVEQILKIKHENTNKIMFFIDGSIEYNNLKVSFYDPNGNTIFENQIDHYTSFAMIFEFPPISKGNNYKLVIEDMDGDNIRLATVVSNNKNNYIKNVKNKTLKLVTYYNKNNYFYIWYPLFLFTFLFTTYPFVWGDDIDEK